jgi:uncharacterized protein
MTDAVVARWRDWAGSGLEHLVLHEAPDGVTAESVVVGSAEGESFAVRYRLSCDAGWRLVHVDLELIGSGRTLTLNSDGSGTWRDGHGRELPDIAGAIDIDISVSPFTNTLPIRRLQLARGKAADLRMTYIRVPELSVAPDPQRYTCLEPGRLYRYDSLDSDFTRDIEVDGRGLVVSYPGLFKRVL